MRKVEASIVVKGRAVEAEQLWYDRTRWASWIEDFAHLARLDDHWPQKDSRRQWDSRPGTRGRVVERVTRYEARVGQTLRIDDGRVSGVERVTFEPGRDETRITLALEVEPKIDMTPVQKLLLRRRMGDALRRTLTRFSYELAAERQFGRSR